MNNGSQNLAPARTGQAGTNTPLSNHRDWQFHAERINAAWGKQVASIIETGRYLIEAYDEMERASFEAMVQQKLAFGPSTARKLIVIAHHSILCAHVHKLPPSWGTLYELTKLPIEVLREKLKNGDISPKLERREVARWRKGESDKIIVDGKAVEHKRKPSLAEQLKAAKTENETLKAKLKSAGGSLFDLALDPAEEIGKLIADNMSESRFDKAVKAAKARYKAKRSKPAG